MTTIFALKRLQEEPFSTAGELWRVNDLEKLCATLERGAHNPDHVRISAGQYEIRRKSIGESHFDTTLGHLLGDKYKGILWLPDVPGRSNIECHPANFFSELKGCIALGSRSLFTAKQWMVIESRDTYRRVYPIISDAIDAGETFFDIHDIPQ